MRRIITGIDAIFLYQFVVYLLIFIWAIHHVATDGLHQDVIAFVVAPPIVLAGYLINSRHSVLLCAAGDLAMAYSVGRYTLGLFQDQGFELDVVLAFSLVLCMAVRFVRDVLRYVLHGKV